MKKIFLAIAVLGIVSVAACSKKDADDSKKNNYYCPLNRKKASPTS